MIARSAAQFQMALKKRRLRCRLAAPTKPVPTISRLLAWLGWWETGKCTGFLCKLLHRLLTWWREKADLLNAVEFAYTRYGTQTALYVRWWSPFSPIPPGRPPPVGVVCA